MAIRHKPGPSAKDLPTFFSNCAETLVEMLRKGGS